MVELSKQLALWVMSLILRKEHRSQTHEHVCQSGLTGEGLERAGLFM